MRPYQGVSWVKMYKTVMAASCPTKHEGCPAGEGDAVGR
jgi:hypothetical protein